MAPKTALFIFLPAGWRWHSESRGTMGMLLYSCVCAKLRGGIKGTGGQTPVMWSLTSSSPDEEGSEGLNKFSPTDQPERSLSHVTLIRARPARLNPPACLQHVSDL